MTGYQFSLINYDTLSTSPWNSMNLHMNQAYTHMQTFPSLFMTQQYSFDNYTPYSSSYSNSFLLDPRYTLMQGAWGTPAWDSAPWNNPNGGWNNWSPWGGNWGGSSSISSSSSTDPEQIKYKEKYEKLSRLAKQLEKYDGLSNEERRTLSAAINNTKGTNEEKFDRLLKAYKSISKETVKGFLKDEGANLAVIDPSTSAGKDSSKNNFYSRLTNAGFEYKSTSTDDEVENFHNSIKNDLAANDGNASTAAGVIAKLGTSIDVLDFISSYNSNYKNGRIIDHISANWSKVKGEMRPTISSTIIDPLVKALVSKAQEVKKSLDEDSQEAIRVAIEELEKAKSNSKTSINNNLSSAFDRLYLLTRSGAMEKVKNDAIAYYGEIDSGVFNSSLFDTEYKNDLEEEGFEDSDIEDAQVTISEKEAKKTKKATETEDSDEVDEVDETEETPEEKEAKEKKKAERKKRQEEEKEKVRVEMTTSGIALDNNLTGWAWSNESSMAINEILAEVDKDNVMNLLTGYYINAGKLGATEGLIERLDDEFDGGKIEMANKKLLINSLLEVAKDVGLETSAHYIKIQAIMKKYEAGHGCENENTFNNGHIDNSLTSDGVWSAIGTLFFSAIGFKTDNEIIDKHMEALFQEIKAKQA